VSISLSFSLSFFYTKASLIVCSEASSSWRGCAPLPEMLPQISFVLCLIEQIDFILIDLRADLVDVSHANERGTHCQLPRGGLIDATPSPKARAAVLYAASPFGDGVALI
jgi:hypothetical protein